MLGRAFAVVALVATVAFAGMLASQTGELDMLPRPRLVYSSAQAARTSASGGGAAPGAEGAPVTAEAVAEALPRVLGAPRGPMAGGLARRWGHLFVDGGVLAGGGGDGGGGGSDAGADDGGDDGGGGSDGGGSGAAETLRVLPLEGKRGRVAHFGTDLVAYSLRIEAAGGGELELPEHNPFASHVSVYVVDWDEAMGALAEPELSEGPGGIEWTHVLTTAVAGRLEYISSDSRSCSLRMVIREFVPESVEWTLVSVRTHEEGCGARLTEPIVTRTPLPGTGFIAALGAVSNGALVYARENDFVSFREAAAFGGAPDGGAMDTRAATVARTEHEVSTRALMPLEANVGGERTPLMVAIEKRRPWGARRRSSNSYTLSVYARDATAWRAGVLTADGRRMHADGDASHTVVLPKNYADAQSAASAAVPTFTDLLPNDVFVREPVAAIAPHAHTGGAVAYGESLFTLRLTGSTLRMHAQPLSALPYHDTHLKLRMARSGARMLYVADGDPYVLDLHRTHGGDDEWTPSAAVPTRAASPPDLLSTPQAPAVVADLLFLPASSLSPADRLASDSMVALLYSDGNIEVYDLTALQSNRTAALIARLFSEELLFVVAAFLFAAYWWFTARRARAADPGAPPAAPATPAAPADPQ